MGVKAHRGSLSRRSDPLHEKPQRRRLATDCRSHRLARKRLSLSIEAPRVHAGNIVGHRAESAGTQGRQATMCPQLTPSGRVAVHLARLISDGDAVARWSPAWQDTRIARPLSDQGRGSVSRSAGGTAWRVKTVREHQAVAGLKALSQCVTPRRLRARPAGEGGLSAPFAGDT